MTKQQVYFLITYHARNPSPYAIQHLFSEDVLASPGLEQFWDLQVENSIPLDGMVIANHNTLNLENIISYQKLTENSRPLVSSSI